MDRAVLDVDGLLDGAEVREKLSRLGLLTPMEVDLEDTGEDARELPAEAKRLLGQLREVSERLFPTACHRQRVAHLGNR